MFRVVIFYYHQSIITSNKHTLSACTYSLIIQPKHFAKACFKIALICCSVNRTDYSTKNTQRSKDDTFISLCVTRIFLKHLLQMSSQLIILFVCLGLHVTYIELYFILKYSCLKLPRQHTFFVAIIYV